jgi:hypothetical protein
MYLKLLNCHPNLKVFSEKTSMEAEVKFVAKKKIGDNFPYPSKNTGDCRRMTRFPDLSR